MHIINANLISLCLRMNEQLSSIMEYFHFIVITTAIGGEGVGDIEENVRVCVCVPLILHI